MGKVEIQEPSKKSAANDVRSEGKTVVEHVVFQPCKCIVMTLAWLVRTDNQENIYDPLSESVVLRGDFP